MKTTKFKVKYPGLKGSEQHHDLKDRPGEEGEADHAEGEGKLPADVETAIETGDNQTQIAAELKRAVSDK